MWFEMFVSEYLIIYSTNVAPTWISYGIAVIGFMQFLFALHLQASSIQIEDVPPNL